MKRVLILGLLGLAFSCGPSKPDREIKEVEIIYDITSIRVDDDAEYHITAISRQSGEVRSISDSDAGGYSYNDISISYSSSVTEPILIIKYDDSMEAGHYRENRGSSGKIVKLPRGYKIDTFDD